MRFINSGMNLSTVLLKSGARAFFVGEMCGALYTPDDCWYRNDGVKASLMVGHVLRFLAAAPKKAIIRITNDEMQSKVGDL